MSIKDYSDKQELEQELKDDADTLESIGEETKDHQEDLEGLYQKLEMLKSNKGLYSQSDIQLTESVESAIEARENSVEECKEKIEQTTQQLEHKVEYLDQALAQQEERVNQMQELVGSLNCTQDGVVNEINNEIENQNVEIQDGNEKKNKLEQIIQISEAIIAGGAAAAQIGQWVSQISGMFG